MRSLLTTVLCASALALAGCSDGGEPAFPSVAVDVSALGAPYAGRVADAAAVWNREVGWPALTFRPPFDYTARFGPLDNWGQVDRDQGTLTFNRDIAWTSCPDHPDFQATALHELGHVLGLEHVDDPEAAMNYTFPACAVITDADRAELARSGF